MPGVVLDVNVLVSSVIAPLGFPRQIFSAWREGRFPLLVSSGMIDEVEEKLALPRIARRYSVTLELGRDTLGLLRSQASLVPVPAGERLTVTGDPEDDLVLATGRLGGAEYLVTGDRGLLALSEYEGMKIVSPREFFQVLAQSTSPGNGT
jgi:putative PIN family toxin of toxin-antitoxin system